MPVGAESHDTGAFGADERWPEPAGELEMAEVVGRELRFIAPRIPRQGRGHDAGIVDENVEFLRRRQNAIGEVVDRRRVEQVHGLDDDIRHPGERLLCLCQIAGRNDGLRAGGAEGARGLDPDTGVTSGHDHGLAGQIDAFDDVGGGRCGSEAGANGGLGCGHDWFSRLAREC
jgi:hypothetical protein